MASQMFSLIPTTATVVNNVSNSNQQPNVIRVPEDCDIDEAIRRINKPQQKQLQKIDIAAGQYTVNEVINNDVTIDGRINSSVILSKLILNKVNCVISDIVISGVIQAVNSNIQFENCSLFKVILTNCHTQLQLSNIYEGVMCKGGIFLSEGGNISADTKIYDGRSLILDGAIAVCESTEFCGGLKIINNSSIELRHSDISHSNERSGVILSDYNSKLQIFFALIKTKYKVPIKLGDGESIRGAILCPTENDGFVGGNNILISYI